jgi:serine O-acetyltransferase
MNWQAFRECVTAEALSRGDKAFLLRMLRAFFFGAPPRQVVIGIRLASFFRTTGHPRLCAYVLNRLARKFGVYVGDKTQIGKGLRLPHPTSVVIGQGLSIGTNCRIYQQVTISGAAESERNCDGLVPRVGNNVILYPGAKIIGKGRVGNNVIIGANAVVTKPFHDNLVLAGVPARVIRVLGTVETPGDVHSAD